MSHSHDERIAAAPAARADMSIDLGLRRFMLGSTTRWRWASHCRGRSLTQQAWSRRCVTSCFG